MAAKHEWYSSVQDTLTFDEEESYFQEARDQSFYLHTLELRLARHRDLSNSRSIRFLRSTDKNLRNVLLYRYQQWMDYMEKDPRLKILRRTSIRSHVDVSSPSPPTEDQQDKMKEEQNK